MMKLKTTFLALALAGAATMAAGVTASAQDKATVGIAMPTKSSARWIDDGNNIVKGAATTPICNMPRTTSRTSSRRSRTW